MLLTPAAASAADARNRARRCSTFIVERLVRPTPRRGRPPRRAQRRVRGRGLDQDDDLVALLARTDAVAALLQPPTAPTC